jgi:hypothetical protein
MLLENLLKVEIVSETKQNGGFVVISINKYCKIL